MRVKCVLCDKIDTIADLDPMAKKLRNRPIHTYMCQDCQKRIATLTQARKDTGKFKLYRPANFENDW